MSLELRQIIFDSTEYRFALALRYKVLREPLGLKFTPEDRLKDSVDVHFVVIENERVLGTLTLTRSSTQEIKMRQLAVDENAQGKGIGRKLVEFSERYALQNGFKIMVLNARLTAVSFYEKLGYLSGSEIFNEVGIEHKKMVKRLLS